MILGILVSFFIVAGLIALPQTILKEFGEITIKKSIIIRVIMSFCFFALIIFLLTIFDSKDQGVEYFDFLFYFLKTYTIKYENFEFIDILYGLEDMELNNNIVWVTFVMFFPQFTLLIPQFLFKKYKDYAEYEEVAVTDRVAVSVDSYGNVSAREANIYNTIKPYLWKAAVAILVSVAIFVPILYAIIKYVSPIYSMLIVLGLDIIIIVLACVIKRK